MLFRSLRIHPKGEFIYRLAGREREKSASYYTPESLTQCLVKYALKELLKDKTADEILSLTVCDKAVARLIQGIPQKGLISGLFADGRPMRSYFFALPPVR